MLLIYLISWLHHIHHTALQRSHNLQHLYTASKLCINIDDFFDFIFCLRIYIFNAGLVLHVCAYVIICNNFHIFFFVSAHLSVFTSVWSIFFKLSVILHISYLTILSVWGGSTSCLHMSAVSTRVRPCLQSDKCNAQEWVSFLSCLNITQIKKVSTFIHLSSL